MLEKQINDLELLKGHLQNHVPIMQELVESLIYRSKEDEVNAKEVMNILNYVMSCLDNVEYIREVSRVVDIDLVEHRFDYVMDQLASTPSKHSDMVDAIIKIEEGE